MLSDRELLTHLDKCFDADEVETLVLANPSGVGHDERQSPEQATVKLIHRPTGIEVVCAEHRTQIRNKVVALRRLAERVLRAERPS